MVHCKAVVEKYRSIMLITWFLFAFVFITLIPTFVFLHSISYVIINDVIILRMDEYKV